MQATRKVDSTSVTRQLDEIATSVGTDLLRANSKTASRDVLPAVKKLSLPSSVILGAINKVLYDQLKFTGNSDNYYNPHNSYIDKVTYVCKYSIKYLLKYICMYVCCAVVLYSIIIITNCPNIMHTKPFFPYTNLCLEKFKIAVGHQPFSLNWSFPKTCKIIWPFLTA